MYIVSESVMTRSQQRNILRWIFKISSIIELDLDAIINFYLQNVFIWLWRVPNLVILLERKINSGISEFKLKIVLLREDILCKIFGKLSTATHTLELFRRNKCWGHLELPFVSFDRNLARLVECKDSEIEDKRLSDQIWLPIYLIRPNILSVDNESKCAWRHICDA